MTKPGRTRELMLSACVALGMTVATLAVLEVVLRIADFKELRETLTERSLAYGYDADLGWFPEPNSSGTIVTFRTTHYKHNSLGLRDDEFTPDSRPTIMVVGDSFVWGLDSEADERFTELLKAKLPNDKVVAAGVSGYGTDQEYLMLRRLWPKIKPAAVILIFCSDNDRLDNISNKRYDDYYKPYFATQPDGSLEPKGQPVPRSHLLHYKEDWLVRNLWLARLATDAYVRLRYRQVFVPDPSEKLVGKMREFVEGNGAKFFVGIQNHDDALAAYLKEKAIPFVGLQGAPFYTEGGWGPHWRPEGHRLVADRLMDLLTANGIK